MRDVSKTLHLLLKYFANYSINYSVRTNLFCGSST